MKKNCNFNLQKNLFVYMDPREDSDLSSDEQQRRKEMKEYFSILNSYSQIAAGNQCYNIEKFAFQIHYILT